MKVVPKPGEEGFSVGQPQAPRSSAGRTILIAAVAAAAGAALIKLLDKTVFKDTSEIDVLKAELARRSAPALAAAPAALGAAVPPPGYVPIYVPREAMNDELWARLAGDL